MSGLLISVQRFSISAATSVAASVATIVAASVAIGGAISMVPASALHAQDAAPKPPSAATQDAEPEAPQKKPLNLEVIIQPRSTYRVRAQEWGRLLQEAGYSPRFREPKPGEALRVEDDDQNGRVTVHVVCGMGPDGSIQIGSRKFAVADVKALCETLDELATYGAGGPPKRNPKWGLTQDQMLEVTELMKEPVTTTAEVQLQSPVITVESLGLPAGIRMTFTDAAREKAFSRRPETAPETLDLNGFSKGTAIAIVLAQYGLGFRPQRVSAGHYNIEIDTGDEASNLWSAGWKTQESAAVILPAWLKSIPVDVEEVEVSTLLNVVADRLEIPVQASSMALAAKGLDLETLTYTRKADRVSPSRLLTAIGDKLGLGFDLRVDEGGKLFLWATTKDESAAFRTRFAHIMQK